MQHDSGVGLNTSHPEEDVFGDLQVNTTRFLATPSTSQSTHLCDVDRAMSKVQVCRHLKLQQAKTFSVVGEFPCVDRSEAMKIWYVLWALKLEA